MKTVEINLPDRAVAGLDCDPAELAAELRVAAAVKWYEIGRVSQEVAAELAGVSRAEFVSLLSTMRVSPLQETAGEALAAARLLREA
jgi:predicted HTH domain antitoxin